jgi:hypothetical protein
MGHRVVSLERRPELLTPLLDLLTVGVGDWERRRRPTALSALSVTVAPDRQGQGLSRLVIQALRDTAAAAGLERMVVPVCGRRPRAPIRSPRWSGTSAGAWPTARRSTSGYAPTGGSAPPSWGSARRPWSSRPTSPPGRGGPGCGSPLLAFVACPTGLKRYLKAMVPSYVYSGPVPVASLATALPGLDVNRRRGDDLRAVPWERTRTLLEHLDKLGVATSNTSGFPLVELALADAGDLGRREAPNSGSAALTPDGGLSSPRP